MALTAEQDSLLKKYAQAVVTAPPHFHLTSAGDAKQFWQRHVQDAVKLHGLIPPEFRQPHMKIIDVGTGNGVPGIPIAILEPSWTVQLLESNNKKCLFIDTFCKKSAILNAHVICGRAETIAKGPLRESFDIVFSRALGKLPVAIELTASFIRIGGLLIVPHGTSWEFELNRSKKAIEAMSLIFINSLAYRLDELNMTVLLFSKVAPTVITYPRAVGMPNKRPL